MALEARAQSDGERPVYRFSASSEAPVARWFGMEVLDHRSGAADLSRLNDGAPVLWNHNSDELIGVVERAWMDDDKEKGRRLMVEIRFGNSSRAAEAEADVNDGILRNVSIGYEIQDLEAMDGERVLVTKWLPMEVSMAPVPADASVGVGRSAETRHDESVLPSPVVLQPESMASNPQPENQAPQINVDEIRAEAQKAERERTTAITSLCRKFEAPDLEAGLLERGATIAEAQAEVLAEIEKRQKAAAAKPQPATVAERKVQEPVGRNAYAEIGMSDREVGEFRLSRLLFALGDPRDQAAQREAAFEFEACQAAAQQAERAGRTTRGMTIPADVMLRSSWAGRQSRAMTVGTAGDGGNLVFEDGRPELFIDVLRNRLALAGLGAMVLDGLEGNVAIPRKTAGATTTWVGEAGANSEANATFDQVPLTPHTVTARTEYSRKLVQQSSLSVESLVRDDLMRAMALEIDRAALYGSNASNQPLGLTGIANVNTQDFAATNPTYAEIVAMESTINADNGDTGSMAYITTPALFGGFKTTEKAANTAQFIYEPGGTVNGYPVRRSGQIESGDVWLGVWSELIMGFWSGLDVLVNPYALATSNGMQVNVFQDVDFQCRHPESFCRGNASVTP